MILAAAAALVFASCAKNEITSFNQEGNAIGFGAYAGRTITKASTDSYAGKGVTTFTATNQHIGVYAYIGTATSATFMNNVDVTLQGAGATASTEYTPLKYWPKEEIAANALSFIGYYPYNATGITVTNFGTTKYGSFNFTVQDAVADQVDLMVSDAVENQYYSTNSGVVPFSFHHALTRVLFQMKTDIDYETKGTTITVNSLEVTNLKNSGTFDLESTYSAGSWGSQAGAKTYAIPVPTTALSTTAAPEDVAANVFLLMPQTIANDAKLNIQYTIKDVATNVETVNNASVQFNTIAATSGAISSWDKNQNVIYTITIGLNPIKFTASITDWLDPTQGAWAI